MDNKISSVPSEPFNASHVKHIHTHTHLYIHEFNMQCSEMVKQILFKQINWRMGLVHITVTISTWAPSLLENLEKKQQKKNKKIWENKGSHVNSFRNSFADGKPFQIRV